MSVYSWPDVFEKTVRRYYRVTGTETYQLKGSGTAYTKSQIYTSTDESVNIIYFYVRGLLNSEIGDLG